VQVPVGGNGGGRELLLGGTLVLRGSRVGHHAPSVHGSAPEATQQMVTVDGQREEEPEQVGP
jgi:hypothetical protein